MSWRFLFVSLASLVATQAMAMAVVNERSDAAKALVGAASGVSSAAATPAAMPRGPERAMPLRVALNDTPAAGSIEVASPAVAAPYDVMSSLGSGAASEDDEVEFADPAGSEVSLYAWMLAAVGLLGVLYQRRTRE